jgi:HD-GYP domain-containing protein (c-di-GMP phosphodiesterase class II)
VRAVPTLYLPEDAVLAEDLFAPTGQVLLKSGTKLNDRLIERINDNKIYTVYINDQHSTHEIDPIVDRDLRQRGMTLMKRVFKAVSHRNTAGDSAPRTITPLIKELSLLTEDVLYEISTVKDYQLDYIDIKSLDDYLYASAFNVAILSVLLGWEMKLPNEQLRNLFIGGLFHDIGFSFYDHATLYKPDALTLEEKREILKHPIIGHGYIKEQPFANAYVKIIALQHHEHLDGSGYPNRLRGDQIHRLAQIVGIADIYDAMTSDRPYRRALPPSEALEYLMGVAGRHFDHEIISAFLRKVNPYPVGSLVKLNTGDVAVVDQVHPQLPLRPKVRLIKYEGPQMYYVEKDLQKDWNLVIQGIHY